MRKHTRALNIVEEGPYGFMHGLNIIQFDSIRRPFHTIPTDRCFRKYIVNNIHYIKPLIY